MTQPTILDLYQDEEYLAIPGVAKGLLQSATPDNPDYRIVDRGNGTEGVFYRGKGGMQYLLGDRPRVIIAATAANAAEDFSTGFGGVSKIEHPPGFEGLSPSAYARGVAETGLSVAKGVVQGFVGLPGDVESISTGLLNNLDRDAVSRIQTSPSPFVRTFYELAQSGISFDKFLAGMEQNTVLPTVKEVSEFIEGTGIMPEMKVIDKGGVGPAEFIGELLAPATYVKSAKQLAGAATKGAEAVKKAVTKRRVKNKISPTEQEPN